MKHSRDVIRVPPTGAPWYPDGIEFALTYNGYVRHGGTAGASKIARSLRKAFDDTGQFPQDLDVLRCALFWEQRYIRWNEPSDLLADDDYSTYLNALLDQIRRVSGGVVPGPPDREP